MVEQELSALATCHHGTRVVQRRPGTEASEANQQMDIGQQPAAPRRSIAARNRNTKWNSVSNESKPIPNSNHQLPDLIARTPFLISENFTSIVDLLVNY